MFGKKKSKLTAINIKPEIFQEYIKLFIKYRIRFLKSSKIDNQSLYLQSSLRKFTVLFR